MTRSRLDRTRRAVEAAASREGFVLDADQSRLLDRLVRLGDELAGPRRRPVRVAVVVAGDFPVDRCGHLVRSCG